MQSSPGFSLPHLCSDQYIACGLDIHILSPPQKYLVTPHLINILSLLPFMRIVGVFCHLPNFIILLLCKEFIYYSYLLRDLLWVLLEQTFCVSMNSYPTQVCIEFGKGELLSSLHFRVSQCLMEHWVAIVWEEVGRKVHKPHCPKVLDHENWFFRLSLQQSWRVVSCRGSVSLQSPSLPPLIPPTSSQYMQSFQNPFGPRCPQFPLYLQLETGQPVPRDRPVEYVYSVHMYSAWAHSRGFSNLDLAVPSSYWFFAYETTIKYLCYLSDLF